jgi:Protein of unknown function (DUF2971)
MTDLPSYPSHLYKYQRLTAHSLASILNDTVWLSKPPTFNDPFDCAITLSEDKFVESMEHLVAEIAQRRGLQNEQIGQYEKFSPKNRAAYEQLRATLRTSLQNIGILSLSAISDHILMWSHYADHHKGFCIEYDCGDNSELKKIANPVKYAEEIPSLSAVDVSGDTKFNFLNVALFTKASQWKYEEEWRLVMPEGGRKSNGLSIPSP